MPMIATTIISSMSVKPFWIVFMCISSIDQSSPLRRAGRRDNSGSGCR
jgi:hypothetical protein